MKIWFKTVSRENRATGVALVDSEQIFNWDAFWQKHTPDEETFLKSLDGEWKLVPGSLLDPTTRQNFICYAKAKKA